MSKSFFKYLSIGPLEEKWGLYATTVGYSKVEANENYPSGVHPQSHQLTWDRGRILNDYYLVFISKGMGNFCSAHTEPEKIEEGACFFLFPGIWHRYKPDVKSGWEEYWIGYHGSYADELMKQGFFNSRQPIVKVGLNKELLALFNRMLDLVKQSLVGYPQQLSGLLLQLLGQVNNAIITREYDNDPVARLISKAKFLMHQSFEKALNMEGLARELPMGYSAFRKKFKEVSGQSPQQYHQQLRLDRAKELLESTVLNIDEIADQTGFESVYYFSRLFKKKTGISPKNYRISFLKSIKEKMPA
ncbi:AraC family transcriptional regulator [Niabella ginsenosidivorans]|uniref:AraC family transcriptional regulator n=1 Tax=Niabella ginsenosidivorans TaxID=1176587 RepID=A0A1A9I989_9BACT|nr:AraC family transcriptional regulator [Niabella ginsenosidivorans]ANH83915.1 AraC family transcriptional regulator [Niabella ginsenosidivorans]